jgi:aminoglycoside phosphotransferase (APT) family kinase protein
MGWVQRDDLRVEMLPGGISNLNYRVDVGDEAYVVRIPGEDSERLGIDRSASTGARSRRIGLGWPRPSSPTSRKTACW